MGNKGYDCQCNLNWDALIEIFIGWVEVLTNVVSAVNEICGHHEKGGPFECSSVFYVLGVDPAGDREGYTSDDTKYHCKSSPE